MQIRKGRPPRSGRLARTGVELSREARVRLAWMDFYRRCRNVARTGRHFGISRQTFYRWQRRYDPYDLTTLEATGESTPGWGLGLTFVKRIVEEHEGILEASSDEIGIRVRVVLPAINSAGDCG